MPLSNAPATVTSNVASMVPINPTTAQYGVFGVVTDPSDDIIVWEAIGIFPPPSVSSICGFQKVNSTSQDILAQYTGFHVNTQYGGCLVDDLVVSSTSGAVYATDIWGYQIFKLILSTGAKSVLNGNVSLLCLSTSTSPCASGSVNGPNGIVLYTDSSGDEWLIINVGSSRLVKMNPTTGVATVISPGLNTPANPLNNMDGMGLFAAGPLNSVLFAVGKTPGTVGTVQVLTSTTEWETFDLRVVYNASCVGTNQDVAVRLAGSDAVVLCNNNFSPGTMQVNTLTDVVQAPIAQTIQSLTLTNMIPESFDYDPIRNMLVVGSVNFGYGGNNDGSIRGFPYTNINNGQVINFDATTMHTYVQGGTQGMWSTAGVEVNPQGSLGSDCFALVAMGSLAKSQGGPTPPPGTAVTGLYLINLCLDSIVSFVSLPVARNGSFANDVTVLQGVAYVSDFSGNQIWAVTVDMNAAAGSQLSSARVVLTASSCASNNPAVCINSPDGLEAFTKNGAAVVIISLLQPNFATGATAPGPMLAYTPSTGALIQIGDPTGVLSGFDSLRFNADQTILYGARNSFSQVLYQTIVAMVSCNGWRDAELAFTFQENCGGASSAPAAKLIPNIYGTQDLVILCNDGFGSGPYSVQVVQDVDSIVTNTGLLAACTASSPAPAPSPSSSSSSSFTLSKGGVAGIVIGWAVSLAVTGVVVAFLAGGGKAPLGNQNVELSGKQNNI